RELTAPQREIASRELSARIVEPLLVERRIKSYIAPVISDEEARLALLHLALDFSDVASEKGLTKRCFESLVMAALHDTGPEARLGREEIHNRVEKLLPAGSERQVSQQIEGALQRLARRGGPVKYYQRSDDFCLSYSERESVQRNTTQFLLCETELTGELVEALRITVPDLDLDEGAWSTIGDDLRFGLETVLLHRGEAFAVAAKTGQVQQVDSADILSVIAEAGRSSGDILTNEQVAAAVVQVLERSSTSLMAHLRRLADAYTMFAFLKQTPDVQKITLTMFSSGDLWLDTTVILPLLAETLLDEPQEHYYTVLIRAARDAGLRLYVTDGVVEEVERHINRSLSCARTATREWRTGVPFLYSAYVLSGWGRGTFVQWAENFRGPERPEDDVRDYLSEVHGIER